MVKNVAVKVSGNIISELSEKVPSYTFAINEILKNSYDACATKIEITYNQDTHILQVYDNGHGMSVENLESLFHIAKSSKRYGEIVCGNRYQQGEKGLGLLAVFKFGNSVTWKTTHQSYSEILELSVERNKLIELEDITEHIIPVTTKDKDDDFNGTLLSIDCSQDNDLHMIENFFKSDINTKKFINLFNDSGIDVTFKLFKDKNKEVKSNKTSLNQAMKNSDKLTIFDIELDLKKNTLITFKKGSRACHQLSQMTQETR